MGLSGENLVSKHISAAWLVMFPLSLGQLKSNINIVNTGAKVSLFWSFDWPFSVSSLHV